MKRKFLACFLVCLFVLSALAFPAAAEDTVLRVRPPGSYPKEGETFEVTVELEGNPGMYSIQYILEYDHEAMLCSRIKLGEMLDSMMNAVNLSNNKGPIIAAASAYPVNEDGIVAVYVFRALRDLDSWEFNITEPSVGDQMGYAMPVSIVVVESSPAETAPPEASASPAPSDTDTSTDSGVSVDGGENQTSETPLFGGGNASGGQAGAGSPSSRNSSGETSGGSAGSGETSGGSTVSSGTSGGNASSGDKPDAMGASGEDAGTPVSFSDTVGHWGEAFVAKAVRLGLFQGYSADSFGPDDPLTRAQFVTVLYRMAGSPTVTETVSFQDIADQLPEFQSAIAWAQSKGYVNGRSAEEFDPSGNVTRQEAMKILFGYAGGTAGGETMFYPAYDSGFADSGEIADWAKPAMYWAYYNTLITGVGENMLAPQQTATRAQLAKILVNYLEQ